jgi:hypothetical protein
MPILLRRRSWGIQARLTMLALVTALPLASGSELRHPADGRRPAHADPERCAANGRELPCRPRSRGQRHRGRASGARNVAQPANGRLAKPPSQARHYAPVSALHVERSLEELRVEPIGMAEDNLESSRVRSGCGPHGDRAMIYGLESLMQVPYLRRRGIEKCGRQRSHASSGCVK